MTLEGELEKQGFGQPRPKPRPQSPTGEVCPNCGGMMLRTGMCLTCTQCGENTGCG